MMHAHQDTENSVIGYFEVTKAFDGVARPYIHTYIYLKRIKFGGGPGLPPRTCPCIDLSVTVMRQLCLGAVTSIAL